MQLDLCRLLKSENTKYQIQLSIFYMISSEHMTNIYLFPPIFPFLNKTQDVKEMNG